MRRKRILREKAQVEKRYADAGGFPEAPTTMPWQRYGWNARNGRMKDEKSQPKSRNSCVFRRFVLADS
ncbi:hypothetical protein Terro_0501 [Terriglobus roseus DSM 18391]|uniref:Uncharacterized protein n=1 Tax=Terriglobus roseus (strain DSM 18391 / NRRL B-41598 / KBS 63) TaxID=926566 RepID=I3ZC74_TERRK|nr:hypothetical protein Terro_0501 [Terriglobus roseus DSM 18391]